MFKKIKGLECKDGENIVKDDGRTNKIRKNRCLNNMQKLTTQTKATVSGMQR